MAPPQRVLGLNHRNRYKIFKSLLLQNHFFSRRAVVSYWRKYVHEVLVNRLGGLSLPRKSVVRLTDRPDMTLDVYRGRKATIQPIQLQNHLPQMFEIWFVALPGGLLFAV